MLSRLALLCFLSFAVETAMACSCRPERGRLEMLEAHGFPPGVEIFHGRIERWISDEEADVQVIEAFSGGRKTTRLIAESFWGTSCSPYHFPKEAVGTEAVFFVRPATLYEAGFFSGAKVVGPCSTMTANPDTPERLRAIAARSNNVDEVARNGRFEAAVRAANEAAQRIAAQKIVDERTLRAYEGATLFKPATLSLPDPRLAEYFRGARANKDFVNVHTVYVDRLAIDSPVTIFEVDGQKYKFVGEVAFTKGATADEWRGRSQTEDYAVIRRSLYAMFGQIYVGRRQFEFWSLGDVGYVYETSPTVVAEREANSRLPQEMARARLAKEKATREAALHPVMASRHDDANAKTPTRPAPIPSRVITCEEVWGQQITDLEASYGYRQPPHLGDLIGREVARARAFMIDVCKPAKLNASRTDASAASSSRARR